jgi:hypothetical protein
MPLRDHKAVSVDVATGAGKSTVIDGLAATAQTEGLVDTLLELRPCHGVRGRSTPRPPDLTHEHRRIPPVHLNRLSLASEGYKESFLKDFIDQFH